MNARMVNNFARAPLWHGATSFTSKDSGHVTKNRDRARRSGALRRRININFE
jgi:hypothetical protein